MNIKEIIVADRQRKSGGAVSRFLIILRIGHYTNHRIVRLFCKVILRRYRHVYGLEIPIEAEIGKELYLGHAYNNVSSMKYN